ncbi:hypothetical protein ACLOJK_024477 [Asimina triloba]
MAFLLSTNETRQAAQLTLVDDLLLRKRTPLHTKPPRNCTNSLCLIQYMQSLDKASHQLVENDQQIEFAFEKVSQVKWGGGRLQDYYNSAVLRFHPRRHAVYPVVINIVARVLWVWWATYETENAGIITFRFFNEVGHPLSK